MRTRVMLAVGVAWAAAGCGARYSSRSDRIQPTSAANSPAELWAVQQPNSDLDRSGGQRDGLVQRRPHSQSTSTPAAGTAGVVSASPVSNRSSANGSVRVAEPQPPAPVPEAIATNAPRVRREPPKITAVHPGERSTLESVADRSPTPNRPTASTVDETNPPMVGALRPASAAPSGPKTAPGPRIAGVAAGKPERDRETRTRPAPNTAAAKPPLPPTEAPRNASVPTKSSIVRPSRPAVAPSASSNDDLIVRSVAGSNGRASVAPRQLTVASSAAPAKTATTAPKVVAGIGSPLVRESGAVPGNKTQSIPKAAETKPNGAIGSNHKRATESVLRDFFAAKATAPTGAVRSTAALGVGATKSNADAARNGPTSMPDDLFDNVTVFYGTDRKATTMEMDWGNVSNLVKIALAIGGATATVIFGGMVFMLNGRGRLLSIAMLALSAAVGVPASQGVRGLERITTYGGERGELVMGSCTVSLPKSHKKGELERPSIIKLEFAENPAKHVVVQSVREQGEIDCMCEIQKCVANSTAKEAFVFVHGYNIGFEEAAQRTAQIAFDLKFEGAPIFFSWPSQAGLFQYTVDETNVQWAVPHLTEFLTRIARNSGAKTIHLIAHSMGNRALVAALQKFANEAGSGASNVPKFNEVVLAAPDIDAETFKSQVAPAIVKAADRLTMYASSTDRALIASRKVHGYPRAGDSGRDLVVVDGIDTVDVSAVDMSLLGHDYYGSNPIILNDLFELLRDRKKAAERTFLRQANANGSPYWVFDPQLARAVRWPLTPR